MQANSACYYDPSLIIRSHHVTQSTTQYTYDPYTVFSKGNEESTCQGGSNLGLRKWERRVCKSPQWKRQVALLQPPTRGLRQATPPAMFTDHDRGQTSCSTDEKPGEGHDLEERPRCLSGADLGGFRGFW